MPEQMDEGLEEEKTLETPVDTSSHPPAGNDEESENVVDQEEVDSDPENLLHSTFMTADVGKLYILLCRALGREE